MGNKITVVIFSILFLSLAITFQQVSALSDGTVSSEQKISDIEGNFGGILMDIDFFGSAVANIGDLDGDGVNDLAVGSQGDNDGAVQKGAVWILFMKTDGTVKSEQKISDSLIFLQTS